MDNFFNKINKDDINSTYHTPYKFLTTKANMEKKLTRIGDFNTTLWLETGGLTVSMSLIFLVPTFILM
jgi:hypothetical protein